MKKQKKAWLEIFKNMCGDFLGGNFPGINSLGVVGLVRIFRVGVFLIPFEKYVRKY